MIEQLKKEVLEANLLLPRYNLVTLTWGNVSAIDREKGLVAIKPSGVAYDKMTIEDIVVMDLEGNKREGRLNPSSDTATHLELYRNFKNIGGIVHTHSRWATVCAQRGADIVALGTTHADYFAGDVPCTRDMREEEVKEKYELLTGKVIVETFEKRELNPDEIPAVLVKRHGPFTWGASAKKAVENALVLEEVAMMAVATGHTQAMPQYLLEKHFYRKHGDGAYYGQK